MRVSTGVSERLRPTQPHRCGKRDGCACHHIAGLVAEWISAHTASQTQALVRWTPWQQASLRCPLLLLLLLLRAVPMRARPVAHLRPTLRGSLLNFPMCAGKRLQTANSQ